MADTSTQQNKVGEDKEPQSLLYNTPNRREYYRTYRTARLSEREPFQRLPTPPEIQEDLKQAFHSTNKPVGTSDNTWSQRKSRAKIERKEKFYRNMAVPLFSSSSDLTHLARFYKDQGILTPSGTRQSPTFLSSEAEFKFLSPEVAVARHAVLASQERVTVHTMGRHQNVGSQTQGRINEAYQRFLSTTIPNPANAAGTPRQNSADPTRRETESELPSFLDLLCELVGVKSQTEYDTLLWFVKNTGAGEEADLAWAGDNELRDENGGYHSVFNQSIFRKKFLAILAFVEQGNSIRHDTTILDIRRAIKGQPSVSQIAKQQAEPQILSLPSQPPEQQLVSPWIQLPGQQLVSLPSQPLEQQLISPWKQPPEQQLVSLPSQQTAFPARGKTPETLRRIADMHSKVESETTQGYMTSSTATNEHSGQQLSVGMVGTNPTLQTSGAGWQSEQANKQQGFVENLFLLANIASPPPQDATSLLVGATSLQNESGNLLRNFTSPQNEPEDLLRKFVDVAHTQPAKEMPEKTGLQSLIDAFDLQSLADAAAGAEPDPSDNMQGMQFLIDAAAGKKAAENLGPDHSRLVAARGAPEVPKRVFPPLTERAVMKIAEQLSKRIGSVENVFRMKRCSICKHVASGDIFYNFQDPCSGLTTPFGARHGCGCRSPKKLLRGSTQSDFKQQLRSEGVWLLCAMNWDEFNKFTGGTIMQASLPVLQIVLARLHGPWQAPLKTFRECINHHGRRALAERVAELYGKRTAGNGPIEIDDEDEETETDHTKPGTMENANQAQK
eukprot:scaffold8828_cov204-Amphora_coffeaeformis.AAC.46